MYVVSDLIYILYMYIPRSPCSYHGTPCAKHWNFVSRHPLSQDTPHQLLLSRTETVY